MLAGYRVLVVEDEALVASTISELLTEARGADWPGRIRL
jgi:hypothetical protein